MQYLPILIAIVSLVAVGCGQESDVSQPSQQRAGFQESMIPADVSYSIINASTVPGLKRSLDVRLNKKVSELTLRAIADGLKSQDTRDYDRTFITYYLPGMAVGAGAWATTHFNPNLELRILGLTAEEEAGLAAERAPRNREIVGVWFDDRPFSGRVMIFRESRGLFIEQTFKDGSSLKQELAEKKALSGRRFYPASGSRTGDHWVLSVDGNLQVRDNDGLISTARRVE